MLSYSTYFIVDYDEKVSLSTTENKIRKGIRWIGVGVINDSVSIRKEYEQPVV